MSDRLTVDTITSDQLDALYEQLERAERENYRTAWQSEVLRRSSAEAAVQRVTALRDRWAKAGPPPLGTPLSRWWDRRLAELHAALDEPKEG